MSQPRVDALQCHACRHVNRREARFCEDCGTSLIGACGNCGHQLTPLARFCSECGRPVGFPGPSPFGSPETYTPKHLADKIATSKGALEGERKLVTVLFADLKGSMEMLGDRDPEEARNLIDPVLVLMMEAVHHYEGTVSLVMGDGIMALFGAPLALEDHAVRACYAALRMQERVRRYAEETWRTQGVNMQIRVGLNSGEVVVRAIGSDLHMDYTAVGRTTHLAARMEQLASPGSVLMTASTLAMVEGFVTVEPLGPIPIEGLSDTVTVYEAVGAGPVRTRLQVAAGRGLTPFVGRDVEMQQLRQAQQRANDGQGQVVAIVAEAGMGKSRLLYEFAQAASLREWLVVQCASVPYGKSTSYLPVINLLKEYFEIHDRDELQSIREKVMGKILALDPALAPTLPALLTLLDVPVTDVAWQALAPSQRREQTLDSLRRLALRQARERPVLLIFQDLHWMDGETQALLDGLVESLASQRVLLLVTYRPEHRDAWGSRLCYSQLKLDTLSADSMSRLLEILLGDDPGLASLKQHLVNNGNPFFLEETVRTLVETKALAGQRGQYHLTQPIQAIQTPASVQVMLAARIDRLAAEDKRVLQTASVIGKEVSFALLQAVAELPSEVLWGVLNRLQSAEFLYQTALFPDLRYAFKHALTQEVAYGELLHERRRELHGRIVDAIEILHHDRLGEQIEHVAHHAFQAELGERAVQYLHQAGLKAAARSAMPNARFWFERALEVLETLPENLSTLTRRFRVHVELRPVLIALGQIRLALERMRLAEGLAERLGDDRLRGMVTMFMTNIYAMLGELDAALATGAQALGFAERLGSLRLRVSTITFLVQAHLYRGDYRRAVELATDNLAAIPADWTYDVLGNAVPATVFDRTWLIESLACLGRFREAGEHQAESVRLAQSAQNALAIGMAHRSIAMLHLAKGDWVQAYAPGERAIETLRAGAVALMLPGTTAMSAWILAQIGDASEALKRLQESERQLREREAATGVISRHGWDYHALGRAALLLGRLDEAQRMADRAMDHSRSYPGYTACTHHLLGDIATHPDRFDADLAEEHYRRALSLAEPRGMRPLVAHCHLCLGGVYRRTGRRQAARERLTAATTMYREMDMSYWLKQAEEEMGRLT
ncbi:AAA family ATPase [Vineibacter terrae]|uniref:AAA family ATPase n=1 Tax=Vineibacter terrae TaxID=2586908 RepID=UPI002E35DA16|nr:adenylate/guanylate cyclase domain-containing protein [Vineibacter terrae]HEX2888008.1 adenylate/guanylate cyclase domain-containing protein [Vineibacter terrae]